MRITGVSRNQWLFSFTDVAFLLLLVYTQLARMESSDLPVAEMRLPVPLVEKSPELTTMKGKRDYYQLLVERHSGKPYRVVHIVGGSETARSESLSFEELCSTLQALRSEKESPPRPVVVPLPESFSSDLLSAAAVVGKYWNEGGHAVVHTDRSEEKQ